MPYDQKRVVDAIRAFEAGEIVVVTDDDGRENEGDLIVAAVHCTPEKMAFIVRHTSGIVCTPMPRSEAKRLNLNAMVAENDSAHTTAFTVTVDFKHGTTTGISADDRTLTVRNLANPNVGPADFVRPGHIFPLIAREGGVLMRSGHTEAAVDLCKLANLPPIGVICELVNDDGTVTRGPQVTEFAITHGLKQVSVADLIAYRQRKETLIELHGTFDIETPKGKAKAHAYSLPWETMQHVAIVFGDIRDGVDIPVRLHLEDVARDVFGAARSVDRYMAKIADEGRGVIIYLREGSVGVGASTTSRKVRFGEESHAEAKVRDSEWLEIGLGAQILRDLGVSSIKLLTRSERHYVGLEGFGIQIAETVIC
ncbi:MULTISPECIES: 3,4-dihydroxy-2-butanone-4-phosphate synthase [Rhizobium/Agrobacterium group]|jgi:3,4-dihydroxy 2-butanone 4-phosphate synthase/GTP cyclohydrolase II|uniref:3,4-dihydroxy-2-butanone-4-phosphate synthase n=1 Tax=Rhizobium/Agrobacterium group TaxID=227290 RepID=UPI0007134BCB|nr:MULTISPECIES: 3,4-dihydroxy-2-butanone-4-phosphate synthase [Rhizobium/Agrobacterium group]RYE65749.1 MAG: 3,4-dihydroxy-2-butanone-4-phosphate synthase [Rhizobiaceae bacterium]KQQ38029.1 3,4-dihydroxy-2-butanone 4-phosphate synthase [Rhizobium sp. Leaf306]KQQ73909.1 3,4-dihydroxy-2-butanone 4-phosphate synthase [Rhizobium sp. Leaf321]MBD8649606.1 3,4-dihydroxy-2-butanone-4-phosphate synthase [Rhizobium sp. CFBP 13726]MBD8663978.1 3,4-dihydroxy-2-butanone-4-phosphate synthase [Rhizobium sp.